MRITQIKLRKLRRERSDEHVKSLRIRDAVATAQMDGERPDDSRAHHQHNPHKPE
jgi:chromosome segregation and condensation protein ScpB